jgi:hypothetical protein
MNHARYAAMCGCMHAAMCEALCEAGCGLASTGNEPNRAVQVVKTPSSGGLRLLQILAAVV